MRGLNVRQVKFTSMLIFGILLLQVGCEYQNGHQNLVNGFVLKRLSWAQNYIEGPAGDAVVTGTIYEYEICGARHIVGSGVSDTTEKGFWFCYDTDSTREEANYFGSEKELDKFLSKSGINCTGNKIETVQSKALKNVDN